MKFRKRKKSTRYRGSQTHRRGHRKRTRGLGNQGGKGKSGSENQKKSEIIKLYGIEYFGGDRALRRGTVHKKLKAINLNDLIEGFDNLVKKGIAKQTPKGFEFNLKGYKLLGDGPVGAKISVKASAASASAIAQIKAAGGSIEVENSEEEANEEKAKTEEKKAEKPKK